MNKTISIALGGFSFIIEENAYNKLNNYLNALRKSLDEQEADEVMYDIEIRIAEIIKENLNKREVVNDDDVEKVIAQIGTPEMIGEQEETYYSEQNQSKTRTKERKQLFRDPEKGKIAGVCAGLAHYIGMDVTLMRFIWVIIAIFSVGFPMVVIYLVLWMVMPQAETATDFLKMKGKPIDFNSIKEESVRFASESSQKIEAFYKKNGSDIWEIVRKVFAFIMGLIAFKFILSAIVVSFGFLGNFHIEEFNEMNFYIGDVKYLVLIMVGLVCLMMAFIFLAFSIKLYSPKTKIRYFGILVFLMFLSLVGLGIYFGLEISKNTSIYSGRNDSEENIAVNAPTGVITLNTKKINVPQNFQAYGYSIFSDKNRVFERDRPDVYIIRKDNVQPYLIVRKKANGYNVPIKMNLPLEVKNGEILFPNYIGYPYEDRFRNYDVDYELVIPRNIQIQDISRGGIDLEDDYDYHHNYPQDNIHDNSYDTPFDKGENLKIETNVDTIVVRKS